MSKESSQSTTFKPADIPELYSVLLNSVHDAVWIIDQDYRIVDINEPMLRKINCVREQAVGRYCYEINPYIDMPCCQQANHPCPVAEMRQKGRQSKTTHTYLGDNGEFSCIEITAAPLKDKHGRIVGAVETHHDISLEKQLKKQLEAIYKVGRELILIQDETAVIERALETAVKHLQYRCASCGLIDENEKLTSLYHFNERHIRLPNLRFPLTDNHRQVVNLANNGQPAYITDGICDVIGYQPLNPVICMPLITQGQTIGVLNIENNRPAAFTDSDQQLLQLLTVQTTVAIANARLHKSLKTQLNLVEETQAQLIQNKKLAAIGELIAGVAHELNNPLAAIILYSQLLQRKLTDLNVQNDLNIIVTEAKRASSIVRALLNFSRQRPPKRAKIQLNDVINSSLELLDYGMRTNNISREMRLMADLPVTMADPYQLQQVFINIINNALQAMSQDKSPNHQLIISSACALSQFPGPRSTREKMIRVTISNTGPHIPKEILPRVFDPFFTTKSPGQGTGLGLSVCHGIINKHDGHIWIESEPDKNTAVHIELPVIAAEEHRKQTKPLIEPLSEDPADFNARILVLDDEENLRQVLSKALRQEGYWVDALANGETALSQLSQHNYDLIICDIRMPGVDGIEFYQQVKTEYPHLIPRIIFTTGDAISRSTAAFLAETGAPCLMKPFNLPALVKRVRQELRRAAQLSV